MHPAHPATVIDDEGRVTRSEFAGPDAHTGTRVDDCLVVPVTGGAFTATTPDGSTRMLTQHAGQPRRGTAGTTHDVTSTSKSSVSFVEIELKR